MINFQDETQNLKNFTHFKKIHIYSTMINTKNVIYWDNYIYF
jgi:hypothetical protein